MLIKDLDKKTTNCRDLTEFPWQTFWLREKGAITCHLVTSIARFGLPLCAGLPNVDPAEHADMFEIAPSPRGPWSNLADKMIHVTYVNPNIK